MAIIINNTTTVKTDSEELKIETKNIESVKASIDYVLKELNEYWSATQEDQQEFYKGLQGDSEALGMITSCNNEFADAMIEYMEVTNKTSSNVYGG